MMHASLGASGAHRWMNCLGSPRMEHGIPDVSGPYAREGTAAHALAQMCLERNVKPDTFLGTTVQGFEVDDEMVEAIQVYVDAVGDMLTHDECELWVEKRFSLARLDPPAPMYGTSDAVVYDPKAYLLTVGDLKYGRGVIVEAEDNEQEMYYALGALLEIEAAHNYRVDKVKLVVVQPRAPHPAGYVRSVTISYEDLIAFASYLLDRAKKTQDPNAPLTPGDWCRFCRAAGTCKALQSRAVAVAQREFSEVATNAPPNPDTLTTEELVVVLDNADLLEGWLASVRSFIMGKLERGEEVPGWKAVEKRGIRRWVSEDMTLGFLGEHGVDPATAKDTKLKSPAQLEKMLKKEHKLPLPDDLYTKKSSGNTMAPITDPRPALSLGPANEFHDESELEGLL